MLFIEIPRAMAGRGICIAAQKSNKPRKWLLKSKQMFVKSYREGSFRDRKGQKKAKFGRFDGITRNRGAVWAFGAKRGNMKKGKPSE